MKKVIQISVTIIVLLAPVILLAQPMPYDQSIGGGTGSNPVGGGAPLGESLILLFSLGIGYGIRKYRQLKKLM